LDDGGAVIEADTIDGFAHEAGGHRIQRVPPTERRGRVHTSTVTVSVLAGKRREGPWDRRAEADFSARWFSGTGKGGQHRNKHQNCVELTHLTTGARRVGASSRSRESNMLEARAALLADLDSMAEGESASAENGIRKRQIGSGMRGDKRRTYRFQDDAVVDHVTGRRAKASAFMRGQIELLWQ
jgi:peptide chain release factor 1